MNNNTFSLPLFGLLAISAFAPVHTRAAGMSFRGNTLAVLTEPADRNTGLDAIYVAYDVRNVDMMFQSADPSRVAVFRYSNLGGGFAEPVTSLSIEGNNVVIHDVEGNMGYIVDDGDKRYCYWLVDYLPYRFSISGVSLSAESDCDATYLNIKGNGVPIHYFTVNGQQRVLDRDITVSYDTQEWSADTREFVTVESVKHFESMGETLRITPPVYCSTDFLVEGDKFMRAWNWQQEAESVVYDPKAVMIATEAVQQDRYNDSDSGSTSPAQRRKKPRIVTGTRTDDASAGDTPAGDTESPDTNERDASNEINAGDGDGLGGSAPAVVEFSAYGTQGVLHHEWQLSKDPEFEEVEYRFNQQEIEYTFLEEGTFYMRYVGSNSDGTCEAVGDTYQIHIGASELLCPNAFTPDGDGVNDKWKVSYRSLIDFECWIFDRFGEQLFHTKDPQEGWDGMRGGKVVPAGVYYYVINATGADGRNYKKSGDINILRHRNVTNNTEK